MASPCKPSSSVVTTAATESSSTETSNPTSTIALSASMTEAMSSETSELSTISSIVSTGSIASTESVSTILSTSNFITEASSAPTTDATTLFTTTSASPDTTTSSPATTSSVAPIAYRVKALDGPIPNAIVRYSPTSGGVLEIASTLTDGSVEAVLSIDPDTGYLSSNGYECALSPTSPTDTLQFTYATTSRSQSKRASPANLMPVVRCNAERQSSPALTLKTKMFWTQLYARSIAPGKYDIGIGRANLPTATWTPVDMLLQELQS
ncbi:hypothetical protein FOMG_09547 [Fusarium oxysporum f. sp. melonis 26406]|uniref:Uncharacterized protein n=1 Tax=Fusarium oxysporum f. sp. melonis 26406 TaxID=1089452 RepID=X0A713_FUSOX|nr:hypothetical protein FOMG_09547 [Fusarium oxysporum f. sp. melonis 26406]